MTKSASLPLIVIVGPTGSGKTALAIKLAKKYDGEIICADSRTIYKHMDIGTAKPSEKDRREVPHWGIDLVEPGERFSAYDFQQYAYSKISEIHSRGRLPVMVGGTGLYVDAVILEYSFNPSAKTELKGELSKMTLEQIKEYCIENNINLTDSEKNKRHLISAILNYKSKPSMLKSPRQNAIVVGINISKEDLRTRIKQRAKLMLAQNVQKEAVNLATKYSWKSEAMTGNIYTIIGRNIKGEISESELEEKIVTRDMQLAKRQMTWFRRRDYIKWFSADGAFIYLSSRLDNL